MNEALEDSIKKWQRIVNDGAADHGTDDCSLCDRYYNEGVLDRHSGKGEVSYCCEGCPVRDETNKDLCFGSPYYDWLNYQREHLVKHLSLGERVVFDDRSKELAQAELNFLIALREKDEAEAV